MRFYDVATQRNEELVGLELLVYSFKKGRQFSQAKTFTVQSNFDIFVFCRLKVF